MTTETLPMLPAETITVRRGSALTTIERKARPVARTAYQKAVCAALLAGRDVNGFEAEFCDLRPASMSQAAGMVRNLVDNLQTIGYTVLVNRKTQTFRVRAPEPDAADSVPV